jgi:hypothetical protein
MPVEIQQLTIQATVVEPKGLLTPEVLDQVVEAVLQRLAVRDAATRSRGTEHDLRSIVEQQRARGA